MKLPRSLGICQNWWSFPESNAGTALAAPSFLCTKHHSHITDNQTTAFTVSMKPHFTNVLVNAIISAFKLSNFWAVLGDFFVPMLTTMAKGKVDATVLFLSKASMCGSHFICNSTPHRTLGSPSLFAQSKLCHHLMNYPLDMGILSWSVRQMGLAVCTSILIHFLIVFSDFKVF